MVNKRERTSFSASPWLVLSIFLWLAVPELLAQSSRGTILGTVRDPSGASVPGTKVTVTNLGTNIAFNYETDDTGNYYVPSLLPGRYRVEAEKAGFKKFIVAEVIVEVNQTARVDVNLEVGRAAETVEVQGASPLVQTDTATLGQVVTNRQVIELPLNGRDFTNLLRLNVGVGELQAGIMATIRQHGLNDSFRSVSVNGARPASVSYLIDGVTTNDPLFQGTSNTPPIDAIQEFKLQNGLYSADYGMGAAQVNVALKSGTNTLHGSLWDFLRNDALQPCDPFARTSSGGCIKDPTNLKQNQFGFTVGGPVVLPHVYSGKNRTFFFFGYQGGRRRSGAVSFALVPTEQEKQGNFSDWPTQLYNPLRSVPNPAFDRTQPLSATNTPVLRQPFLGNQIPSGMIATQSQNLLKYWPKANLTCTPLNSGCPNYQAVVPSRTDTDQYTIRMDHDIRASDKIAGTFLVQKEVSPTPSIIPLSGTKRTQSGALGSLQWTHSLSPRTLNEARFGYSRLYYLNAFETAFGSINYWKDVGLQNLRDNGAYFALPLIGLSQGYSGVGPGGSLPFFNISNIFQWVDNLSLTRGRHTMKLGADIRRNQNMNLNGFGGNGQLFFLGQFTAENPSASQSATAPLAGNSFADFLLGYPNQAGGVAVRFSAFDQSFSRLRNTDFMYFFQDDFHVNPQLTLNLGLRWELHTPYHDKTRGGSVFDFNAPAGRVLYIDPKFAGLVNNNIGFGCCGQDSLINTDWHDFAPRIGFAWRPRKNDNKLVLRGGYGIFYDVLMNFYPTQSVSQNIPFVSPTLPNPVGTENPPPLDMRNLFPAPYTIAGRNFPPPYCDAPSQTQFDSTGQFITAILHQCFGEQTQLPDNKTPYLQQWGFNVQYAIKPNLLVELGYQGSHGLREPIQWIFNQASPPPQIGNPNNGLQFDSQCPGGAPGPNCSPYQDRVPYRNFVRNSFANANILQSKYNAMTFKVDKRFSHGLQTLVSFTWGHAIDQFSEIQAVGGSVSSIAQNAHDWRAEWGSANFDQTRRLVTNWLYELPFGRGKTFLNRGGVVDRLVGGWQVNGIVTLSDGTPFTIGCFCGDRAQIGNIFNVERPNLLGNPKPSGFVQSYTQWFDTTQFEIPTLGTLGTAGRNIVRSTGQTAGDFSLFKNTRITERASVQFRAEFFNLFWSPTYFPRFPSNNLQDANIGRFFAPTQNRGVLYGAFPRIVQLALKFTF